MENLISNVLTLVKIQNEINLLSDYLCNCPINAVDFQEKYSQYKEKKESLQRIKNLF